MWLELCQKFQVYVKLYFCKEKSGKDRNSEGKGFNWKRNGEFLSDSIICAKNPVVHTLDTEVY